MNVNPTCVKSIESSSTGPRKGRSPSDTVPSPWTMKTRVERIEQRSMLWLADSSHSVGR